MVRSQGEQHEAAVYDAICAGRTILRHQRDRARAAFALGASFLGARQAARSNKFEERHVNRAGLDADGLPVQAEFNGRGGRRVVHVP